MSLAKPEIVPWFCYATWLQACLKYIFLPTFYTDIYVFFLTGILSLSPNKAGVLEADFLNHGTVAVWHATELLLL